MKKVKIMAKIREKTGTRESRRLRKNGYITAEIYGAKEKNYHIILERKKFEKLWHEIHGETVIFEIELDDKKYNTVIKEIQRDVLYGYPTHIDFQILHEKEEITVPVPVILKGEAKGVKLGGILEHFVHQLHVRTIPSKIPGHIEIDISNLNIGESIHVRDIKLEKGVKIEENPDETICTIASPRGVEIPIQEVTALEVKEEKKEEKDEEEKKKKE
ncbi:MAG: 50S ribosomal protein L25 [Candidatus Hydrothermales bacterium]